MLAAAFTPDGRVLTGPALGDDGVATVRDATTGRVAVALRSPRAAEQGAVLAAVSPNGRRAVTATFDRVAVLWDLATGRHHPSRGAAARHGRGSAPLPLDRGDAPVATGIWSAGDGEPVSEVPESPGFKSPTVAFSPDGELFVVTALPSTSPGTLAVRGVATGRVVAETAFVREVLDVAFSPGGDRVISASRGRDPARIWERGPGGPWSS